ncbi:hypothetical protein [Streptomyces sp. NPDC127084]|uniref:hypothetical protein n=1 Tax=Streptomyces sp. NPDC127084 TaxID=3347133 RepID=UPI0036589C6D
MEGAGRQAGDLREVVGRAVDAYVITEAHQGYGLSLQRGTFVLRDRGTDEKAESFEQLGLFDVGNPIG